MIDLDEYEKDCRDFLDNLDSFKYSTMMQCTKALDLITEIRKLREVNSVMKEGLQYYSNHESVIAEAYHSNDERQITCVHTFINHKAKEALAKAAQIMGEK